MRTRIGSGWLWAGFLLLAAPGGVAAQADPGADALDAVRRLFDAMREKDRAALEALFHPEARLMTAGSPAEGAPALRTTPVARFVESVATAEAYLDERLYGEEVRVEGGLATVWVRYNLFVDGSFSHCGVDAFQLVHGAGGWRIFQITDTRTRDGCDPALGT